MEDYSNTGIYNRFHEDIIDDFDIGIQILKAGLDNFQKYHSNRNYLCKINRCEKRYKGWECCIHKKILIKKLCFVLNLVITIYFKFPERNEIKRLVNCLKPRIYFMAEFNKLDICRAWYMILYNEYIPKYLTTTSHITNYDDEHFLKIKYFDKKSIKLIKIFKMYEEKRELIDYFLKVLPKIESILHLNIVPDVSGLIKDLFIRLIYDEYSNACYKST